MMAPVTHHETKAQIVAAAVQWSKVSAHLNCSIAIGENSAPEARENDDRRKNPVSVFGGRKINANIAPANEPRSLAITVSVTILRSPSPSEAICEANGDGNKHEKNKRATDSEKSSHFRRPCPLSRCRRFAAERPNQSIRAS